MVQQEQHCGSWRSCSWSVRCMHLQGKKALAFAVSSVQPHLHARCIAPANLHQGPLVFRLGGGGVYNPGD